MVCSEAVRAVGRGTLTRCAAARMVPDVLLFLQREFIAHGGLEQVGIFRLAPDDVEVRAVKVALNQGESVSSSDVNCIAHLIKVRAASPRGGTRTAESAARRRDGAGVVPGAAAHHPHAGSRGGVSKRCNGRGASARCLPVFAPARPLRPYPCRHVLP